MPAATSNFIFAGQTTGIGTSAISLATGRACTEILVQSDPANTSDLLVGDSTSQPVHVVAGASITVPVNDISKVWVKAASGTVTANWLLRE